MTRKPTRKAYISVFTLILFAYILFFAGCAKVSYDIRMAGEGIKGTIPYETVAKNDNTSRLFKKVFRNFYTKLSYKKAAELIEEGYYDERSWFELTGDPEYINWRMDFMPRYGEITDKTPKLPIICDDSISISDYYYTIACIETMPDEFIDRMAKDGWKIKFVSSIEDKDAYGHDTMTVVGQTWFDEKEIWLASSKYGTVYHEFGHVLAGYAHKDLGKAGLLDFGSKELSELFNHNANGSLYIYMTPEEQLAESFYDYLFYPREMKQQAPNLYRIYDETSHEKGEA